MTPKINLEILIILTGFVCGLLGIVFIGDRVLDNEWGVMVNNLENHKILSYRNINGEWVPNIFMPPLYPIFLFGIKKIFFFCRFLLCEYCFIYSINTLFGFDNYF